MKTLVVNFIGETRTGKKPAEEIDSIIFISQEHQGVLKSWERGITQTLLQVSSWNHTHEHIDFFIFDHKKEEIINL